MFIPFWVIVILAVLLLSKDGLSLLAFIGFCCFGWLVVKMLFFGILLVVALIF